MDVGVSVGVTVGVGVGHCTGNIATLPTVLAENIDPTGYPLLFTSGVIGLPGQPIFNHTPLGPSAKGAICCPVEIELFSQ